MDNPLSHYLKTVGFSLVPLQRKDNLPVLRAEVEAAQSQHTPDQVQPPGSLGEFHRLSYYSALLQMLGASRARL